MSFEPPEDDDKYPTSTLINTVVILIVGVAILAAVYVRLYC